MIAPGRVIAGQFEILDRIGEGGMATVYRAHRLADGRTVALKVLREQYAADAEFVERFAREATAVSALEHPHMVRVFGSGRDGDLHYIAMEYVEGTDLKRRLRTDGPLPVERALQIAAQVAGALEFAHRAGIVHRDIKPQNILLTASGAVKVTDFGIARAAGEATITQTGTVLGSVQYLSPEQARGAPVSEASDIYALGVVLYEMVTGTVPFDGDSPIAIALQHVHQAPPPPRTRLPALPERVEGIILRAMAKSPADRYRSAGEMRTDLLGETDWWRTLPRAGLEHTPPTTVVRPAAAGSSAAPRPPFGAVAGLALVALLVGGIWGGWRAFSSYLHVPEVTVPALIGRPIEAARQAASAARLNLEVAEEVFSPTVPAGAVVSQDQPAGKRVKVGRLIRVTVSLGPEMVTVPDVQRRSLLEARLLIDQARLRLGELREAFDEEVKGGFIIRQDPQPGARVERGKPVNVVVSKGPQRLAVPLLVGRSLTDARRMLAELGITLADVRTVPSADVRPGTVVEQRPAPGTLIRAQDPVIVTVTARPGQEDTPPPSPVVTAQPQPAPAASDEKATRVQLVVPEGEAEQEVKIVVIDARGVTVVFHKTLPPGSRVDETVRSKGFTIIQVFVQNRLVQEIRP